MRDRRKLIFLRLNNLKKWPKKRRKRGERTAFVITMKWLTYLLAAVALAAQEVTGFAPIPMAEVSGGDGRRRKEKCLYSDVLDGRTILRPAVFQFLLTK